MGIKRIWFHCTEIDHGDVLTIERRPPKHRLPAEPDTPRLCVCPSVPECFGARLFNPLKTVHVYATRKPQNGIKPIGIWDQGLTREHWLIPPTQLRKVAQIESDQVKQITLGIWLYHTETQKGGSADIRVAAILRAFQILGHEFAGVNQIGRMKRLKCAVANWFTDPDDHLLNETIRLKEKISKEV